MEEILERIKSKEEVRIMSPLVWAYVGDCVYELFIRTNLINTTKLKVHDLHVKATGYVKAASQAELLDKLKEILTQDEREIVRRARNTQNHHLPKNANLNEYMYATAFEGLIGFLYLTKQNERLKEILDMCF